MEAAIAEERVLIKETAQEVARQILPNLIGPILDRLAKETMQAEIRLLMDDVAKEIIEKVVREVVPAQAETEVKKEIERLTADA